MNNFESLNHCNELAQTFKTVATNIPTRGFTLLHYEWEARSTYKSIKSSTRDEVHTELQGLYRDLSLSNNQWFYFPHVLIPCSTTIVGLMINNKKGI